MSKIFRTPGGEVHALKGLSFVLGSGEIVAIVGPSGSGKSTLMNLIGALDLPTGGEIAYGTFRFKGATEHQLAKFRNRSIGFVFQNYNLIPVLTARENVELPSYLGDEPLAMSKTADPITKATQLLNAVGLGSQVDQKVNTLSGGQMQRVAIARALMNNPSIILADEPTANLDHDTAISILNILSSLSKERGVTVVVATHDQTVLTFCERILSMRDGELVKDERP